MARVKFRRWGPYVWWICPSRKCNFENKTDLVFVQGAFETKCQYCNTPVTIKMSGGQLSLESTAVEEEEPKVAASPSPGAKPTVASPSPPSIPPPKTASPPTPIAQVPTQSPSTQTGPTAPSSEAPKSATPTTPVAEASAQKQESAAKAKEAKKKAAS